MFFRKRRCLEVGSPIAAPSGPGTPPAVVDSAEGGSGVKHDPMMVYGNCAASCCTISEDDSFSIVVFAGILEIKFLELRLEQLFVRQFGFVLSDQSCGETAAECVFDYLIVFAGTQ
jgi:hypothetical protein